MLLKAIRRSSRPTAQIGRNRAFHLLLAGSSVSMLGSRVTTIACPMLVLYLTGSPVVAGWVAFAATAPSILVYMPAGALVDRWKPRRVMLLSEFGRGVAIATVAVTLTLGRLSISLLIVMVVIEEILEVFSTLAERRYVRSLVRRDQVSSALVRIEARTHVVVLAGRPLGGFLFGLSPILPFLANVLSFIVSLGAIIGIESKRVAKQSTAMARGLAFSSLRDSIAARWHDMATINYRCISDLQLRDDIREGLRWLRGNRFACTAMGLLAGATLISQALIMVFLAQAQDRHLPSIAVGIVLAASGAGGALGSAAASGLSAPVTRSWLRIQLWIWLAAFVILIKSDGDSLLRMAIVMAILGFTGAVGNIVVDTYLIQNAAESMLGRVTSIGRLTSFAACAAGPVLGGFLFQKCGVHDATFWLLVATTVLAFCSILTPSISSSGNRTEERPGASVPDDSVSVMQLQDS
jgi:MFS family permease